MGNRAIIQFKHNRDMEIYVHWNGGADSIIPLVAFMRRQGYRGDVVTSRMLQILCNFHEGGLSVYTAPRGTYGEEDNGTFEIDEETLAIRHTDDGKLIIDNISRERIEDMCTAYGESMPRGRAFGYVGNAAAMKAMLIDDLHNRWKDSCKSLVIPLKSVLYAIDTVFVTKSISKEQYDMANQVAHIHANPEQIYNCNFVLGANYVQSALDKWEAENGNAPRWINGSAYILDDGRIRKLFDWEYAELAASRA